MRTLLLFTFLSPVWNFGLPNKSVRSNLSVCDNNVEELTHRRRFLWTTISVALTVPVSADAAVLQSGPCVSGEGEACASLAGENEFIKALQQKSAEKREIYAKEARDAYNMKNYPDYFASMTPPRILVKKQDGTYTSFTEAEFDELKKAGKISLEYATAKGGKVRDYSLKPMMILKD